MTMGGYYEFEVHLADINPRIWRRFQISDGATFNDLHHALQDAFGWEGGHLWEFMEPAPKEGIIAGVPGEDYDGDTNTPDADTVSLTTFFGGKGGAKKCLYLYDFGDYWEHDVLLKGEVSVAGDFFRKLIGGERACPLEDCGGVPGYERIVDFLAIGDDPDGEDAEEFGEWVKEWRPDEFDLEDFQEVFNR